MPSFLQTTAAAVCTMALLVQANEMGAGGAAPNSGYASYIKASRSTNSSRSVAFTNPVANGINQEWSWQVNISAVPLSNISTTNSDVIFTQLNLKYPGGGDINKAWTGGKKKSQTCAYVFSGTLPANVSSRYKQTDDSSCVNFLGQTCFNALVKKLSSRSQGPGYCDANPHFPLAGCEDTLNLYTGASSVGFTLGEDPLDKDHVISSGTPFYYYADFGGNQSSYQAALNTVQMMAITSNATGEAARLFCNRIANDSAVAASLSSAAPSTTSAAATGTQSASASASPKNAGSLGKSVPTTGFVLAMLLGAMAFMV